MVTRALALVVVAVLVGTTMGVAGLFGPSGVEASNHSATRSFNVESVGSGGHVRVTISVADLGGFGQVVETLPEGFTYESSTPSDSVRVEVDGQDVKFTIFADEATIEYTVNVPEAEETYSFVGVASDSNRDEQTIGGATDLRVGATAARTITRNSVAVGDEVDVSISASGLGDFGQVTETLPEGFTYASSEVPDTVGVEVDGQVVKFTIIGSAIDFTYTVTSSEVDGTYSIEGVVTSSHNVDSQISGDSTIGVEADVTELPEDPTLELPPTGDVAIPGWLIAVLGLMGALMLSAGATLAFRYGRSATGRLT